MKHTGLLQCDDHGARAERVPGCAVVSGQEVGLHHVVDGERGEDASALCRWFALLHRVPLQQRALLLLPHVLLPRPHLQHTHTQTHTRGHNYITISKTVLIQNCTYLNFIFLYFPACRHRTHFLDISLSLLLQYIQYVRSPSCFNKT